MIFDGKITQTGTSKKPSSKLSSRAFDVVKSVDSATHIRTKSGEFVPINENLLIKRLRKGTDGNPEQGADGKPVYDFVHYTEINDKDQFICIRNGEASTIDGSFYAQVVFMKKSEQEEHGSYFRCDDGVYIHKDEIQVPAYKKVQLNEHSQLKEPVRDGEFYVQTEQVILPDGTRIMLPNDRVRLYGEDWQYRDNNNEWIKCDYRKTVDTQKKVEYILLDNSKMVSVKKLKHKPNGDFVLENIDGEDIIVGKKTTELEHPFIEGSTMVTASSTVVPRNLIKQRPLIEQGVNLSFVWRVFDESGLKRIDVNKSRTKVVYTYTDGHREIYALHDVVINNLKPGDKEYRVGKIDVVDLGDAGIKIEFLEKKKAIAERVRFLGGKLNSCTINDRKITNIRWDNDDILPSSYIIDGTLLSNIEWHAGEVESCIVHLIDDEGNAVEKEVRDFRNSNYKDLAITYEPTSKLEDVKTNGETISFKIGDYRFVDAKIVEGEEGNRIGKCTLKYKGKEEEIDLRIDPRFKQLRIAVNIAIDEQRVIPLVQSQLLTKKNGKFELEADVVQAEQMFSESDIKEAKQSDKYSKEQIAEMTKHVGVAKTVALQSVAHAVKEQEKFKDKPFKSTIIDDKNPNKTHTISDFKTTYEGVGEFGLDNNIVPNLIGKTKVEIDKGDLKIDSKKDDSFRDNSIILGFALCSNPFTLVFGVGYLITGATYGMIAPIVRKVKKAILKHQNPEKIKQKVQDKAVELCKKNINELVVKCQKELNTYKSYYSQDEYNKKSKEIIAKFKYDYHQEVCKLQILGGGAMNCAFDPTKKNTLIPSSHLAYLEYLRKRKMFEKGAQDKPRLKVELKKQLKDLEGDELILKKVELLEQYGGRDSQVEAHKLKLKHFKLFLDKENRRRLGLELKGIEPEDYKKQLMHEYREGRAVWGSIDDKLDAFKESIEYKREDRKTQREMFEKKRKELEKEAKENKLQTIEFNERLDKNGNPMIESCTRSAMSYLAEIESVFENGGKVKHKFDMDYYEKFADKNIYRPGKLSEASARRISTTACRKLDFYKGINHSFVRETAKRQEQVAKKVNTLQEDAVRLARISNYEKLFETGVLLEREEQKFKDDCEMIIKRVKNTPHSELNKDVNEEIKESIDALRVKYEKQHRVVAKAKRMMQKQYEEQVKSWALEEFAQTHKAEYAWFTKYFQRVTKSFDVKESSIRASFFTEMCKNREKSNSYRAELETYKVKHHVEENIEAETFCEVHNEEYLRFIEERNANSSAGELDPNSEIARCYFYAHWKKENSLRVDNFKRYFAKKNLEKAKQRIEQGNLVKHEPKIIKGKGAKKNAEVSMRDSHSVTPPTQEEGLTA